MDARERLARVRERDFTPSGNDRLRPQDLPIPAYVKSRGPSGVQAYLAAHGIQLALPAVIRFLRGEPIKKNVGATFPALAKAPKVYRMKPRAPKLPQPKLGGQPDRIFGQNGSPLLGSKR